MERVRVGLQRVLLAVYRSDGLAFKRLEHLNVIRANEFAGRVVVLANDTCWQIASHSYDPETAVGQNKDTTRPLVVENPAPRFALA
jgi:hypothetical protein